MALIKPAASVEQAVVTAVAARDRNRAEKFARQHEIPTIHASYDDLLADPDIDVIYNPLPNGLHGRWSMRALEAGKDVLCEKPLAANAEEAALMIETAQRTGRRLVEAFHYRYHRLIERTLAVIAEGKIGQVRSYEIRFIIPIVRGSDIRYRFDLAGGASMDLGCYAIHLLRTLAAAEPEVRSAIAVEGPPNIDRSMETELAFADGRTAHIECSMWSPKIARIGATIRGDKGSIKLFNFIAPQFYNRLTVKTKDGTQRETVRGPGSYTAQLSAFTTSIADGTPLPTEGADCIANMQTIDAIYAAAGLPKRQPSA